MIISLHFRSLLDALSGAVRFINDAIGARLCIVDLRL
jgi:hypothetical protein